MRSVSFSIARLAVFAAISLFTFLSFASAANAQASRSISTTGRRLDDFNRQSEKAERDSLEREMAGRKPTAKDRRQAEARKTQIKEDLENLQTSYNDVISRLRAKEQFTDTYIAALTEKILKSSARLRHNVGFPLQKSDDTRVEGSRVEAVSLEKLCLELHAFLTNPIFESGVLDLNEAEKAHDALEKIILAADSIQKRIGRQD